jgi:hypothetical protein
MHEGDDDHAGREERQGEANPPILAGQEVRLRDGGEQHALHHHHHARQVPHLLPHNPRHRRPAPHPPLQLPVRARPILERQLQLRVIAAVELQHVLALHARRERVVRILRVHLAVGLRALAPHRSQLNHRPPIPTNRQCLAPEHTDLL